MPFNELKYLNDYELRVKLLDMVNWLRSHFQLSDKSICILTGIPQDEMKYISSYDLVESKKDYILRLYKLFQILAEFEKESKGIKCQ